MKSANWMAFYVGDYAKNTLKLTTRQHGAYLLLILACWQEDGSVDGDDDTLAHTSRFVFVREIPKTASGKILRRLLRGGQFTEVRP